MRGLGPLLDRLGRRSRNRLGSPLPVRIHQLRRLRLVVLLVATAAAVPLGLLVQQAWENAQAERSLRHRAVADRVIDEMERELTAFVRREEDRPYDQYRFFVLPLAQPGLDPSPLAQPPRQPFVVGYFQIEPDGTVTSPIWPRNQAAARAAGWRPEPGLYETFEALSQAVSVAWAEERTGPEGARQTGVGATVALVEAEDQAQSDPQQHLLQKLNRAVGSRESRATKVAQAEAQNVYNFSSDESNVLQSALKPPTDPIVADGVPAGDLEAEIQRTLRTTAEARIDVRLEPMVGRATGGDQMLLYRTAVIRDAVYRQGLVLSTSKLVDWLAERVLVGSDVAGAVDIAASTNLLRAEHFAYQRRFGDPFGSVVAVLTVRPLPEQRGARYLLSLTVLLVAVSGLGLLAVERMVTVVVNFAERRSNFVSSVTHELKTPLTAIRMHAEMLRDGMVEDESKRRHYYETLTAEGERLSRLIDNVLDLSKVEGRGFELRLAAGELRPVLEEVARLLGPQVEREGLKLHLEIDTAPTARFDRDALLQVLLNLVDNAVKYSRAGSSPEILLACRDRGDATVVTVSDRGPGIPRRHLKRVFQPFYRCESELTRTSKGSGIGLALVRSLVEAMGGSVSGKNRRDGGFEVAIVLPKAEASCSP